MNLCALSRFHDVRLGAKRKKKKEIIFKRDQQATTGFRAECGYVGGFPYLIGNNKTKETAFYWRIDAQSTMEAHDLQLIDDAWLYIFSYLNTRNLAKLAEVLICYEL